MGFTGYWSDFEYRIQSGAKVLLNSQLDFIQIDSVNSSRLKFHMNFLSFILYLLFLKSHHVKYVICVTNYSYKVLSTHT